MYNTLSNVFYIIKWDELIYLKSETYGDWCYKTFILTSVNSATNLKENASYLAKNRRRCIGGFRLERSKNWGHFRSRSWKNLGSIALSEIGLVLVFVFFIFRHQRNVEIASSARFAIPSYTLDRAEHAFSSLSLFLFAKRRDSDRHRETRFVRLLLAKSTKSNVR